MLVYKNAPKNIDISDKYNIFGVPSEDDYNLLKEQFLKGEFPRDKLFVFTVKACDNLIDRSGECFSHNALMDIAALMTAKPGLNDHDRDIEKQYTRVYKTELVKDTTRKNDFGEDYEYVLAYCYMVNNKKNEYIIDDILSGIRKEVSVGCSSDKAYCNICGTDLISGSCTHTVGKEYNGKKCTIIIDGVDDFYELSAVPVPCQREAGIIKSYKEEVKDMDKDNMPKDIDSLMELVKKLSDDIDKQKKIIKKMENENKETKIELLERELMQELKPVNDSAAMLLHRLVMDNIIENEGEYSLSDEFKQDLKDNYWFLFNKEEYTEKEYDDASKTTYEYTDYTEDEEEEEVTDKEYDEEEMKAKTSFPT